MVRRAAAASKPTSGTVSDICAALSTVDDAVVIAAAPAVAVLKAASLAFLSSLLVRTRGESGGDARPFMSAVASDTDAGSVLSMVGEGAVASLRLGRGAGAGARVGTGGAGRVGLAVGAGADWSDSQGTPGPDKAAGTFTRGGGGPAADLAA